MDASIDTSKVLQASEILICVEALHDSAYRIKRPSKRAATLLTLFRLATGCGLRRKEIIGLDMKDVVLYVPKPHIRVRAAITKASCTGKRRPRTIPLLWDTRAMADLEIWQSRRIAMGAGPNDPFLCSLSAGTVGKRVSWSTVEKLWSTCVKPLGPIRASQVSVHQGRHSFVSHAIASGRNLTDVRDAAGHSSVATTNIYSHALDSDVGRELYGPTRKQQLREAES